MPEKKFQITYLEINDIMGLKHFEMSPSTGKLNLIKGKNGAGKTSVIKSLKAILSGGHDVQLLRDGEEVGEIAVLFENGFELKKKVTEKGSTVSMKDADGNKVKTAASMLKGMVDPFGLDPVKFLTASHKERVKLLLDSISMDVPREKIKLVTGVEVPENDKRHALQIIEEVRQEEFDARANTKKEMAQKEILVGDVKKTIPLGTKKDADFEKAFQDAKERRQKCEDVLSGAHARLKAKAEAKEKELNEKAQKLIEDIKTALTADIATNNNWLLAQLDLTTKELDPDVQEAIKAETLAEDSFHKAESLNKSMEFVAEGEAAIKAMRENVEKSNAAISGLDKIKEELVSELPFPGLKVKDGDIFLDNIPFDKVNTSKQVQFALSIAGMRDSDIPVVFVDGLEVLDPDTLKIFAEEASKTNMQFFGTRVTDDEKLTLT